MNRSSNASFREKVCQLMAQVPAGEVVTYGDLAGLAGQANAARIVGGIAHYGDPDLPWHRLVNRFGGMASAFPGGPDVQAQLLVAEGVMVKDAKVVEFADCRWRPEL